VLGVLQPPLLAQSVDGVDQGLSFGWAGGLKSVFEFFDDRILCVPDTLLKDLLATNTLTNAFAALLNQSSFDKLSPVPWVVNRAESQLRHASSRERSSIRANRVNATQD
jgi:hypothetical protein